MTSTGPPVRRATHAATPTPASAHAAASPRITGFTSFSEVGWSRGKISAQNARGDCLFHMFSPR